MERACRNLPLTAMRCTSPAIPTLTLTPPLSHDTVQRFRSLLCLCFGGTGCALGEALYPYMPGRRKPGASTGLISNGMGRGPDLEATVYSYLYGLRGVCCVLLCVSEKKSSFTPYPSEAKCPGSGTEIITVDMSVTVE
jgi:hypothetical protein